MPEEHKIRNGIWYTLIFSLISLVLIFQVLVKVPLNESFSGINWFYIALGFLALFLIWLAKACRMYFIGIGMGIKIELSYYLQMYLATCFISHVTPFNSGGTPLQIYLLHKKGVSVGRGTALTAVDLGLNTAMFFVLIPVAIFGNIYYFKNQPHIAFNLGNFIWLVPLIGIGFLLVLLVRMTWFKTIIKKVPWIIRLLHRLKFRSWRDHIGREWDTFKEGWSLLISKYPVSIVWALLATIVYWFFYLLLAPLILWALAKPISFLYTIGLQLLFNFAQILIPTPGGSGGSELVLLYMFKPLTGPLRAGTFVLLWKMYTFFSTLITGGFFFWKLTK